MGPYLLKNSVNLEADYASNNIVDPENQAPVDYHAIPHSVFPSPQVGLVGLIQQKTEGRAEAYITSTYNKSDTA